MPYLLDTNTCIQFLNIPNSSVTQRLSQHQPSEIRLCTVVMAELYYGAWKSTRRDSNLARLQRLFSQFEVLDFDSQSVSIYGRIRTELEGKGTPIGGNDLLIAAISLAHNLVLVTHNTREFSRVEELAIEDWEM